MAEEPSSRDFVGVIVARLDLEPIQILVDRRVEIDRSPLDQFHHCPGRQDLAAGAELEDHVRAHRRARFEVGQTVCVGRDHGSVGDVRDHRPGNPILVEEPGHLGVDKGLEFAVVCRQGWDRAHEHDHQDEDPESETTPPTGEPVAHDSLVSARHESR